MVQISHLPCASEEPFTARAVFLMKAVKDLDRHKLLPLLVPRFPDGGEAAAVDGFEKLETALTERVAGLQALTVSQGSPQTEDLLPDVGNVLAGDGEFLEPALRRRELLINLAGAVVLRTRGGPRPALTPRLVAGDPPDETGDPLLADSIAEVNPSILPKEKADLRFLGGTGEKDRNYWLPPLDHQAQAGADLGTLPRA